MAMNYDSHEDPFSGGVKTPALSWKDLPIGSTFTLRITEPPTLVHSRNYDDGTPAYWDTGKTQPKMCAVITAKVLTGPHSVGELRGVWAKKPSSLFAAIAAAQAESGERLAVGGILKLKFAGETKHENKRFNAIKNYKATYEAPDAFAEQDEDTDAESDVSDPTARYGSKPVGKPGKPVAKPGKSARMEDDDPAF